MEKFILRHRKKINGILVFGLMMAIVSAPLSPIFNVTAQESAGDDVTVTATIQEWITFTIANTALNLEPDLVASDGSTSVGVASTGLNLGTNSSNGWYITVQGVNDGLDHVDAGIEHTIDTVTGRVELLAGTDGYGVTIEDLENLGEGNTLTVLTNYVNEGNFVGEVPSVSATEVVNYDGPHEAVDVANFHVRAAAEAVTPSGDYTDTITVTAITGQI